MAKSFRLAVLGSPIAHSRSPQLQTSFANDCGITDFSYERIETTRETLLPTVRRLCAEGYDGFNCTMPLKTDMALLADVLGDEARDLCSANTVAYRDGKLYADTTDGGGILLTIRRGQQLAARAALENFASLRNSPEQLPPVAAGETAIAPAECACGKRVMLLGAGGAARSTALSLRNAGAVLTIHNRTLASAEALRTMLRVPCECKPLDEAALIESAKDCDILINCTSAGMAGQAEFESLAFVDALPDGAMVIDAVYNPLETRLLAHAKTRGLSALSGLWMLVYQGALAFEKWTGVLPDEDACLRAFEICKN
ncbi:MAG: shikimate dehydrogenase [Ruminococcaceae bacterium]|nr:shikimate dehydrogenase [Oscillospiraceae bacterium]